MSTSHEKKTIAERIWLSILFGLVRFFVTTISFSLLFVIIFIILRPLILSSSDFGPWIALLLVVFIPLVIGGISGVRHGITYYNQIYTKEKGQESKKLISIYAILAIISLVAGMLSSSLFWLFFGSFSDFFTAFPNSIFTGGIPSLIVTAIVLAISKKLGTEEKDMKVICLITGVIVGVLCWPLHAFGNL